MQTVRAPARPRGPQLAGPRSETLRRAARAIGMAGALLLVAVPAFAQAAQANWWESITGSGTPDYTGRRGEERTASAAQARARAARRSAARSHALAQRRDDPAIQAAIDRYEQLVAAGGWPLVPPGRMMREGDEDERIPLLRKRLRLSGDLLSPRAAYNSYIYDDELADGGAPLPAPQRSAPDGPRRALDLSGPQHARPRGGSRSCGSTWGACAS